MCWSVFSLLQLRQNQRKLPRPGRFIENRFLQAFCPTCSLWGRKTRLRSVINFCFCLDCVFSLSLKLLLNILKQVSCLKLLQRNQKVATTQIKQYFRLILNFLMLRLCMFTWLSVSCCDGLCSWSAHVVAQDSCYSILLSQHDWKCSDVLLKMFRCDATNRTGHVPKSRQKYSALFPQTQQ